MKIVGSDHPKRKEVIVKLARLTRLASVDSFEELPGQVRHFYSFFPYTELVRPLVAADREPGVSQAVMARTYGLTKRQIGYMICCKRRFWIK